MNGNAYVSKKGNSRKIVCINIYYKIGIYAKGIGMQSKDEFVNNIDSLVLSFVLLLVNVYHNTRIPLWTQGHTLYDVSILYCYKREIIDTQPTTDSDLSR